MDDDDKAALIAEVRYMADHPDTLRADALLYDRVLVALESQPDLERVKREAGAAALREAAEWYSPNCEVSGLMLRAQLCRRADRIERGVSNGDER